MKDLILLCGPPGAGKTTWAKANLLGYYIVESDEARAQLERTRAALEKYDKVAVARTFAARSDRTRYVALGREFGAKVKAYWFDVPLEECERRCRARFDEHRIIKNEAWLAYAMRVYVQNLEPINPAEVDEILNPS